MFDHSLYPQGARIFNGPDGLQYRWRPNGTDVIVSRELTTTHTVLIAGHDSSKMLAETSSHFSAPPA
jgi:hypothetical protein